MATVIRLRREGTKNRPFYRIVVTDKQSPRNGKFLELLGTYDPIKKQSENFSLKSDRIQYWLSHGAQPSETVKSLLKKAQKNSSATVAQ